ncbi:radical SAM domain protein [Firmicutes bacterium CAG:882]|nr:radical SAM domain protein [Firmicutes bacterium CAG:882]
MLIKEDMDIKDKLKILADSAKYDAACTSSGSDRRGSATGIGSTVSSGICHSFAADGRCISLLKILFTNECIYDCRYCINRRSNDVLRTSFTPEEVCTLTMEFYRRNYIEGLFLSSGIVVSPTHTMQLLLKTVKLLRCVYHFNGYIHVKGIPGADPSVIEETGWYVDRMSVNLELATADALRRIAPNKSRRSILTPMRQIQLGIRRNELLLADYHSMTSARPAYIDSGNTEHLSSFDHNIQSVSADNAVSPLNIFDSRSGPKAYVPAGQSTQMIIGAAPESDYQLVTIAEALYKNYNLKRVFYSAFVNVNNDSSLPSTEDGPPLLREHRLYQADWLLRFYGFSADELLSESHPNFNSYIDPKCDWALQHLGEFPVEINKAAKAQLLRIPGVGPRSVERILRARRSTLLDFKDIARMGVVMKRARYFITCNGRTDDLFRQDEDYIVSQLMGAERRHALQISQSGLYRQLSLFDDNNENYAPLTASSR